MTNSQIVIISGPTGIGKTSLAIAAARQLQAEIVSADSMQIYRQMTIGSAKPTAAELDAVPHHLIDIVDPDESFDAAAYERHARACIDTIMTNGKLPLVVGGTGFYIKALLYGLFAEGKHDRDIRRQLQKEAENDRQALYQRLERHDPETAARLHPNDTYRIVRALETFLVTGKPQSEWHKRHGFRKPRYESLKVGLHLDRAKLYERIDRRVDQMIQEGLVDEVRRLLAKGYDPGLKAMQAIGYRHMVNFLQGEWPWDEAIALLKRDTRRYAKRQLTWLRAESDVCWLAPDDTQRLLDRIRRFLNRPEAS